MKIDNINRIWILGDLHFGVRQNTMEWLDNQTKFFNDFFIPQLKKNVKEGDILIQLGDVFDNRQSLNIKIMHKAVQIFKEISEIIPTYIICGNHDIYEKNSNEISSIDVLNGIPNLHIFKEDQLIECNDGFKFLLMPWQKDDKFELETLSKYDFPINLCFSHSELQGALLTKHQLNEHGNSIAAFKNFKKVYSGHIHFGQKIGNFNFVGTPYELTRSDIGNKKGFYIYDVKTDTDVFIENKVSPKFKIIKLEDFYEKTLEDFFNTIKNCYVDLHIKEEHTSHITTELLQECLNYCKKIDTYIIAKKSINETVNHNDIKNFTLDSLYKEYVLSLDELNENDKFNIIEYLNKAYTNVINNTNYED